MKELLRLEHVHLHSIMIDYSSLRDYGLSLFTGTIMAVYGTSGCGKEALIALLEDPVIVKSGTIYFEGRKIRTNAEYADMKRKVYCYGSQGRIVKSMTVLDNLLGLQYVDNPFRIYQPESSIKVLQSKMNSFNIQIPLDAKVSALTRWERQKLDLFKAYISGARLIVINFSDARYDRWDLLELKQIVSRLAGEGIAFLLITDKINVVTEIAQYNQLMYRGRDIREWQSGEHLSKEQLDILHNTIIQTSEMEQEIPRKTQMVCLYDEQWQHDMLSQYEEILVNICKRYPGIARHCFPYAESDGKEETVCVTRSCHNKLPQNMTPPDILTMGIPERICRFGFIQKHRISYLYEQFCEENQISQDKKKISDYTATERKILAIHRHVLKKPHTLVIEDPFFDLDYQGVQTVSMYLIRILKTVPRIIILAQSTYDIPLKFQLVIVSRNGVEPSILDIDESLRQYM